MADIRDPSKFIAGRWAYDKWGYSEAFGGKITPSDLDAIVERNRRFLCLEHKEDDGRPGIFHIPKGQEIMLRRLAELPQFTVLFISGVGVEGDPRYVRLLRANVRDDAIHDLRALKTATERRAVLFGLFSDWWNLAEEGA